MDQPQTTMRIVCLYIENDTMCTEIVDAFNQCNVACLSIVLPVKEGSWQFDASSQLSAIFKFKADVVFFINTFGIDKNCHFLRALDLSGISQICWFIDNPFYFVHAMKQMRDLENFHLFCWDSWYLPSLKQFGFNQVNCLPQATNPGRFYPQELSPADNNKFDKPLTFAGNLDYHVVYGLIQSLLTNTGLSQPQLQQILNQSCKLVLMHPERPSWDLVHSVASQLGEWLESSPPNTLFELTRIIEMRISIAKREEMVRSLAHFPLSIWGEPKDWQQADVHAETLGRVSYFVNMPKVYTGSTINLNLSRYQQRFGTNQRVFDVPACQSFLLADFKEDLEDFFKLGEECVTFRNFEELHKLIAYYQDPGKRKKITDRGYERILNQHTYVHRVHALLEFLHHAPETKKRIPVPEDITALNWLTNEAIERHDLEKARFHIKTLHKIDAPVSMIQGLEQALQKD